MIDFLINILIHEYTLTLYGVILWQIEQSLEKKLSFNETIKKIKRNVISSFVWVGFIIVFDDELLARYNEFAHVDYETPPFFMYILGGFLIDFFRTKYKKFKEENIEVQND
jgi:hypothetical protein